MFSLKNNKTNKRILLRTLGTRLLLKKWMPFLIISATLVYIPFLKWRLVDMILWRIPASSWIITQSRAIVAWETILYWWSLIRILGFLCHVKYLINWSLLLPFIVIVIICVDIYHMLKKKISVASVSKPIVFTFHWMRSGQYTAFCNTQSDAESLF
jgi:hypothetical protein